MPVFLKKNDVAVVDTMYTDYSGYKPRPAVVVGIAGNNNYVVCPFTSQPQVDGYAVPVVPADVMGGKLNQAGFIRVNRIFTVSASRVGQKIGRLAPKKVTMVETKLEQLLK